MDGRMNDHVRSFVYRLLSLGMRFGCPLLILYVSNPDLLGEYYLFSTAYTLLVFLVSLEIGVVFAGRYLQSRSSGSQREIFTQLNSTQAWLGVILAAPVIVIYAFTKSVPTDITLLLVFFVISEACVSESGRFFWNIGRSDVASYRDFARAIAFSSSIIVSVIFQNAVVTVTSLLMLLSFNISIIAWDLHRWGVLKISVKLHSVIRIQCQFKKVGELISISKPQILHLQILSLLPLIERASIEKVVGLALVGSYSFQYSLVQSGATLFLMPKMSELRRLILSAPGSICPEVRRASAQFLFVVIMINAISALATYIALPTILIILNKTLFMTPLMMFVIFLSSCAITFASTVSPQYASIDRILSSNVITLICMTPIACVWIYAELSQSDSIVVTMLGIGLAAALQIASRLAHAMNITEIIAR